jgi:hypothetical protein
VQPEPAPSSELFEYPLLPEDLRAEGVLSDGRFVKVYKLKMIYVLMAETENPILAGARLISLTCEVDDKRILPTDILQMTPWDFIYLMNLIHKHKR